MVRVRQIAATADPERLVCRAARGDYMRQAPWNESFEEVMRPIKGADLDEKIENFLIQLISAGHWGPFEHPTITFGVEGMSRVTLAQLTRHRLASFDIQSGRFVNLRSLRPDDFVWPPSFRQDAVISRDGGRREIALPRAEREELISGLFSRMIEAYDQLVDAGVPREDARYIFPLATPVNGTMTVNARSLMHIIAIRSFGDAQWEIRDLVGQMLELAKAWMPVTFLIFEKRMKTRDVIAP
ncbi:MAG: FAD-dependent thymidylate synthase [Thermoplasmata archaeon]